MPSVIRGFPAQGVVACFVEPNTTGDIQDFDAPRNDPVKNPQNNLSRIIWHSDFFPYELAVSVQNVTVNHLTIPTRTNEYIAGGSIWGGGGVLVSYTRMGNVVSNNYTLYTHNLGYKPLAFVLQAGVTVTAGLPIQQDFADGTMRQISSFVTDTIVGIREVATSGFSSLPAINKGYQIMIFSRPYINPESDQLFGIDGDGNLSIARDKINSSKLYARQVSPLESAFSLNLNQSVDIANGRTRHSAGGVVTTDAQYTGNFIGSPFTNLGL